MIWSQFPRTRCSPLLEVFLQRVSTSPFPETNRVGLHGLRDPLQCYNSDFALCMHMNAYLCIAPFMDMSCHHIATETQFSQNLVNAMKGWLMTENNDFWDAIDGSYRRSHLQFLQCHFPFLPRMPPQLLTNEHLFYFNTKGTGEEILLDCFLEQTVQSCSSTLQVSTAPKHFHSASLLVLHTVSIVKTFCQNCRLFRLLREIRSRETFLQIPTKMPSPYHKLCPDSFLSSNSALPDLLLVTTSVTYNFCNYNL